MFWSNGIGCRGAIASAAANAKGKDDKGRRHPRGPATWRHTEDWFRSRAELPTSRRRCLPRRWKRPSHGMSYAGPSPASTWIFGSTAQGWRSPPAKAGRRPRPVPWAGSFPAHPWSAVSGRMNRRPRTCGSFNPKPATQAGPLHVGARVADVPGRRGPEHAESAIPPKAAPLRKALGAFRWPPGRRARLSENGTQGAQNY